MKILTPIAEYIRNVTMASIHLIGVILSIYKPRPGKGYWINFLIGLDEFGNAVTGGDPDETISSRSAKARLAGRGWGCVMCQFLGWVASKINRYPTDHCTNSLDPSAGASAVIPDGD